MRPTNSIPVVNASGPSVATYIPSGTIQFQTIIPCDSFGHMIGTRPTNFFHIPTQIHVAAVQTKMWDLWNESSGIVRVISIEHVTNIQLPVTGSGFQWVLYRTSSSGNGGIEQTSWSADTADTTYGGTTSLIRCRIKPTGAGAALVLTPSGLRQYFTYSEETQAGNQVIGPGTDIVPKILQDSGQGIVLRPREGLSLAQQSNSNQGNSGWLIGFIVE